ncbi:MAG TPA: hypothetical protein VIH99_02200 [Bdellovibrionota bacterium]|jgi:hypothetical protein
MQPQRKAPRLLTLFTTFTFLLQALPVAALAEDIPVLKDAGPEKTIPAGSAVPNPPASSAASGAALCDWLDNDPARSGFGGEIIRGKVELEHDFIVWPPFKEVGEGRDDVSKQDQQYQNAMLAWMNKWKKKALDETSVEHMKFAKGLDPRNPADPRNPNVVDLSNSIRARTDFFNYSFGDPTFKYKTISAAIEICEGKRRLARDMIELPEAKKQLEADTTSDVNSCSGAALKTRGLYLKANRHYNALSYVSKWRLEGKGQTESEPFKRESLEKAYFNKRAQNKDNLSSFYNLIKKEDDVNDTKWKALISEFEKVWGVGSFVAKNHDGKVYPGGFFSDFLLQTRQEKKNAESASADFKTKEHDLATNLQERCKSTLASIRAKGPSDITGGSNDHPQGTPPSGKIESTINTGDPAAAAAAAAAAPAPEGPVPSPEPPAPDPGIVQGAPPPPPPPEQGPGVTGFMKDNWMWLAGGAAVAGGGYLLYKKNQDDKKKKKKMDKAEEAAMIAAAKKNKGSSVVEVKQIIQVAVPAGAGVPPGTRIVTANAVNGATQGQTLPTIEVILVDAAGLEQKVDGLSIEASCLLPNPCTLTGGKSVTTIQGHATFNSLSFTGADKGVRLQFAAPGVNTYAVPESFDVVEVPQQ